MKRILYMAAAFAVLAGCSKTEMAVPGSDGTCDIAVSVAVDNGAATKSVYDGEGHLKFESGDAFYGAIAKKETPTKAVKVASKKGAEASIYAAKFTIADASAAMPVFNGGLYSIVEDDFADEYILYGLYPGNSSSYYSEGWSNLASWMIQLPSAQKSTQTTWAEDADIMVLKPTVISTSDNTYDEKYGEYTTAQNESVKFAHLFGFGKFTFEGVPAEYSGLAVKNVTIEAVGENRDLAGTFNVDITKDVEDITLVKRSTIAKITLEGDGKTTVADYVAWFVANSGTYDVKVTVETGKAALVFERQGLVIRRSQIASPVINFKETDTVESHDVVLENGEKWAQTSFSSYIGSSNSSRVWGEGDKKMEFTISYPGSEGIYGESVFVSTGKYAQGLSNNNKVEGGVIILSSAASFKGVKRVKLNLGNSVDGMTNDFTVKLVDGAEENVLGKVSVTGSDSDRSGTDFYFTVEGNENGQFVLVADNLSAVSRCKPFVGCIVLNPEPEIVFSETAVKVGKEASSGEIACNVYAADGEPAVAVDADWIDVTYADGKISYTITENTGSKRIATITVTATGLAETVETITVTQASATAVQCKLTVSASDFWPLISAAKEANPTAATADLTGKFMAKATDGSGKTIEVEMTATKVALETSTEEVLKTKSGNTCKIAVSSSIGSIEKVTVVSDKKTSTSNYADLLVKLSADGKTWTKASSFEIEGTSAPFTNVITNDNDEYTWFSIEPSTYYVVGIYSFEVTFIAE
ncbi:MAG: hypothetical protein NC308_09895 [Clostridium sp.]|nr:hypothetical protein [Bacteroides sp.]MCM1199188.1 hypothetical protein [Clostridium sp.]